MNFYTINLHVLLLCVIITPPPIAASNQQSLKRSKSLSDAQMRIIVQKAMTTASANKQISPPISRSTSAVQLVAPVAFKTGPQSSAEEVTASEKRVKEILKKYKKKEIENKLFHSRATAAVACITAVTPFFLQQTEAQSRFGIGGGLLAANSIISMLPTITATLLGATILYKINYYIHAEDRNNFNNLRRDLDTERRERIKGDHDTKQACMDAVTRLKDDMSMQNNNMTELLKKAQGNTAQASALLQQVIPEIKQLQLQQGRMEHNVKNIILPAVESTLHQATAMRKATEADLFDELDRIQIPLDHATSANSSSSTNVTKKTHAGSWKIFGKPLW